MSSSSGFGPQSLSFDRAAPLYDETRGYAPDVAEQIGAAIVEAAGAQPDTRFLEVGVGTGRIALPIARLGYDYTGVDISEGMMARLRDKAAALSEGAAAPLRLEVVTADMTALPFPDASFDAAVAVHVFHLVRDWKQAVDEVLRVLRPGGLFLHCWDTYLTSDSGAQSMQERWVEVIRELGGEVGIVGATRRSLVTDYLRERGLTSETLHTVTWTAHDVLGALQGMGFATGRGWEEVSETTEGAVLRYAANVLHPGAGESSSQLQRHRDDDGASRGIRNEEDLRPPTR